jgi:hypothetical protein
MSVVRRDSCASMVSLIQSILLPDSGRSRLTGWGQAETNGRRRTAVANRSRKRASPFVVNRTTLDALSRFAQPSPHTRDSKAAPNDPAR